MKIHTGKLPAPNSKQESTSFFQKTQSTSADIRLWITSYLYESDDKISAHFWNTLILKEINHKNSILKDLSNA